jgi:threonine dehydratase
MFPINWISQAAGRIAPHIQRTSVTLDAVRGWYFKWENQQVTGSFKVRGALNKVLALEPWEQALGLVTASAGNHGQGLAFAGRLVGAPVKVFVSDTAVEKKIRAMRALGAEVELVPGGYEQAEAAGIRHAALEGKTWVSAYNDAHVISGQGTVGLELAAELELDETFSVILPASGGGLAAGVAAALSALPRRPRVVAAQPQASAFLYALYNGGTQAGVVESPTLADGLTGAVESGSLTIPMVRQYLDDFYLVDEQALIRAVAFAWTEYGQVIEPSAAVGLAVLMEGRVPAPAVVVISGGNIEPARHAQLVAEGAQR